MLGFLILVQSFVQVARPEASAGDNDLKLKISVMPRTDFRTMLRIVTDLMTPESTTAFTTASPKGQPVLVRVIENLNTPLDTKNWFWNRSTGTELRLPVTQWLQKLCAQPGVDQIAINDKDARNGQIGGLGNKVERMIGEESKDNAPLCPILEFRSVGNLKWTQVASQAQDIFDKPDDSVNYDAGTSILQTLEQWVRDHHSKALNSYSRASTPATSTLASRQNTKQAPGFIEREYFLPDIPLMILIYQTEMTTNAAGFAFGQLVGGQTSGAGFRRPAPPPPPTTQTPNPRPPPPPPPVSFQAPPPSAGPAPKALTTPNSAPQQTVPNSQGKSPPVIPARKPGSAKVPPPVPARAPTNK